MKKTCILLLCICILSMQLSGVCYSYPLTDINEVDPVAQPLIELNILEGYGEENLKLDCEISRAEFAKMVYVLINGVDDSIERYAEGTSFQDMREHWARCYAEYGYESQLMVGSGDKFHPDDPISIVEIAKVILCVLGLNPEENTMIGSGWKESTIALGKEHGIFMILPDTYEKKATRRNVCEIFNYLLRDVEHATQEVEEYALVIESSYDEENDTATVILGYGFNKKITCTVSDFYVLDEKYPTSLLNDTAEKFAYNRKFGYIYRYKMNEDGTVDLAEERGVAPHIGDGIEDEIFMKFGGGYAPGTGETLLTDNGYYGEAYYKQWLYPLPKITRRIRLVEQPNDLYRQNNYDGRVNHTKVHFETRLDSSSRVCFERNGIVHDKSFVSIVTKVNSEGVREAVFLAYSQSPYRNSRIYN